MMVHQADGTTWAITTTGSFGDHGSVLYSTMSRALSTVSDWPTYDLASGSAVTMRRPSARRLAVARSIGACSALPAHCAGTHPPCPGRSAGPARPGRVQFGPVAASHRGSLPDSPMCRRTFARRTFWSHRGNLARTALKAGPGGRAARAIREHSTGPVVALARPSGVLGRESALLLSKRDQIAPRRRPPTTRRHDRAAAVPDRRRPPGRRRPTGGGRSGPGPAADFVEGDRRRGGHVERPHPPEHRQVGDVVARRHGALRRARGPRGRPPGTRRPAGPARAAAPRPRTARCRPPTKPSAWASPTASTAGGHRRGGDVAVGAERRALHAGPG